MAFKVPEQFRIKNGLMGSGSHHGNNGAFAVKLRGKQRRIRTFTVIASDGASGDGQAWEHVSVSLPSRCPTWEEMCEIKALFWDEEDTVVQFHPRASSYVNQCKYCLHLWRKVGEEFELPPIEMV